jgi:hypothetical protein
LILASPESTAAARGWGARLTVLLVLAILYTVASSFHHPVLPVKELSLYTSFTHMCPLHSYFLDDFTFLFIM